MLFSHTLHLYQTCNDNSGIADNIWNVEHRMTILVYLQIVLTLDKKQLKWLKAHLLLKDNFHTGEARKRFTMI